MKLGISNYCRRSACTAAAVTALLVLGGSAALAQTPQPPYGTIWDCLISGSGQQGIAFLTFSNDFTGELASFSGFQLLVSKQSASSASSSASLATDQRNTGADVGRSTDVSVNPVGGGANLFGYGPVSGLWRYDEKGRVIGYFQGILNQQTTITTNENVTSITGTKTIVDTNGFTWTTNITTWTTNTSYVTNTIGTTNNISFTAKVNPGKHLSLVSSTTYGKVSYNGVPQDQKPIPAPIAGTWYGAKKENQQTFVEFFNLAASDVPNIYSTTNGQGPGFSFYGYCMVSVQRKIGFAFQTFPGVVTDFNLASGGVQSATLGPVSYPAKGARSTTRGFEDPIVPVTLQVQRQGP